MFRLWSQVFHINEISKGRSKEFRGEFIAHTVSSSNPSVPVHAFLQLVSSASSRLEVARGSIFSVIFLSSLLLSSYWFFYWTRRLFPRSLCSLVWCVHGARCALEQIQTCSGVRLCFLLYLLFLDSVNAPKRQKSVEISLHCESGSSRLF